MREGSRFAGHATIVALEPLTLVRLATDAAPPPADLTQVAAR